MKYIELVNDLLKKEVSKPDKIILFGQNINAGSCLGGLTRGLIVKENSMVINSTNSENSLCGFGFGLMMNGVSSIFFMKQLDFLLLGIDHLVNTYNIIRNVYKNQKASFTIMPIIVDSGYQGPHSSLNNFSDFCSMSRVPGFTITNKFDAQKIISSKLISPGFRIIGVSQRLFKEEIITPEEPIYSNEELTVFQYSEGQDATIVCFNLSFPLGWNLCNEMKESDLDPTLFNVNSLSPTNWDKIIANVKTTQNLVIIDDSKSENLSCDALVSHICEVCSLKNKIIIKKPITEDWLNPVHDQMEIDNTKIISSLKSSNL